MNINEKTWNFIREHTDEDVRKVALLGVRDPEINLQTALRQIAGRQTARSKLPSWASVEGIVYPPHINMEQCSSEETARYKCKIVGEGGDAFVDLTGGFGVDFYWVSQGFKRRYYIEQNEQLCAISSHNFALLGLDCSASCCDSVTYLSDMPHASLVYMDPARRDEHGGRTYGIADCAPNVLELLPLLMAKADRVLLKLSPMLDWRKAVGDIQAPVADSPQPIAVVNEVHIVSVDNECKELLLLLSKEQTGDLRVVCVNGASSFAFFPSAGMFFPQCGNNISPVWEYPSDYDLSENLLYLYEPNASIMKAGCFAEVAACFAVRQVSDNSHLFVSPDEISGFPGRKFQVLSISSLNKQELKMALKDMKQANITVRNFPMSVDQLRKKLKLKDGGEAYIFATTMANGAHRLLICRKIG